MRGRGAVILEATGQLQNSRDRQGRQAAKQGHQRPRATRLSTTGTLWEPGGLTLDPGPDREVRGWALIHQFCQRHLVGRAVDLGC